MKKLSIEDGLLLVDMELFFNDKSLHLQRVLVDTGSGGTIVSTDLAESIGIVAEENDRYIVLVELEAQSLYIPRQSMH